MASEPKLRPKGTTTLSSGMICILLGFGSFALARGRDGFDKGLFIGMTVGLMVLGAYLVGSTTFRKTHTPDDTWLPSRDER